jgi:hypothetical protein
MYTITYLFTPTVYTYLSTGAAAAGSGRRGSGRRGDWRSGSEQRLLASRFGPACRHELCAIEPVIEPVPSPVIVSLWRQRVRSFR